MLDVGPLKPHQNHSFETERLLLFIPRFLRIQRVKGMKELVGRFVSSLSR